MKRFFGYLAKNWLTTLIGVGQLASVAHAARTDPSILATPAGLGAIASGLALVGARDPRLTAALVKLGAPDKQA